MAVYFNNELYALDLVIDYLTVFTQVCDRFVLLVIVTEMLHEDRLARVRSRQRRIQDFYIQGAKAFVHAAHHPSAKSGVQGRLIMYYG